MSTARNASASSDTNAVSSGIHRRHRHGDFALPRRHHAILRGQPVPHAHRQHHRQQLRTDRRSAARSETPRRSTSARSEPAVWRCVSSDSTECLPCRISSAATCSSSHPPGFRTRAHLEDRRLFDRVRQHLEHVERRHQIERAAAKGDVADGGLGDAMAVGLRELGADARQVEADGVAKGPQHLEIRAGAAAAIEDPRRRHAGGGARDRGAHVLAEATKPEVRLLGLVGQFK